MSEIEREDIAAIRYAAACAKDLFPHVTIDPTIDPATAIEICDLALRALDQAADARLGAADTCSWTSDEDGIYSTGCGNEFAIDSGTPTENRMRWCCYCGRTLREEAGR